MTDETPGVQTAAKQQMDDILIAPADLAAFGSGSSVADQAHALLLQQRCSFGLARQGYAALDGVEVRQFEFDGFAVYLQFNAGRMRSSAARVDAHSIGARPCFLCAAHLPPGQRGLQYGDGYLILANPYPIAPEHLTIPALAHTPQRLRGAVEALLRLARDLSPRYTVVYNGPQCGASAPDHLHFQAVPTDFLPLDRDFTRLAARHGIPVRPGTPPATAPRGSLVRGSAGYAAAGSEEVQTTLLPTLVCPCVVLESDDLAALARSAGRLLDVLADLTPGDPEPMVNLIVRYAAGWRLVIIPRRRHRPSTYPADGKEGIVLSPASVDLGGVCITPRRRDFERLGTEQLGAIFAEVCLGWQGMRTLAKRLQGLA